MDTKIVWLLRFTLLLALAIASFLGPKWAKETDKDGRIVRRYSIVGHKIGSKILACIFLLGALAALYSVFVS